MSRFTFAIILFVVSAGLLMALVWPAYTSIAQLNATLADRNSAIANLNLIIQSRDRLQEEYGRIPDTDTQKLNELLPTGPDIRKLLVGMGALAAKDNMALRGIDFAPAGAASAATAPAAGVGIKPKAPYQTLPFHFSVSGSYESFLQFLSDLQLSVRPIDVVEIGFSGGKTRIYDFTVKAITYYSPK